MPRPRLLISVRNASEAADALAAGADLIDVKEPHRGALGMADGESIREVLATVAARVPTSIALGELEEANAVPRLDQLPTYAKFGLAGAARAADWQGRLCRAIGALPRGVQPVAVAYADWRRADAPPPQAVLSAAIELGCRGLLVDTFSKTDGSLTRHLAPAELHALIDAARQQNLITVLAGGLRTDDLTKLMPLGPDFFGFRGAVCQSGRAAMLEAELVRKLKELLRAGRRLDQSSLARNHSLQTG